MKYLLTFKFTREVDLATLDAEYQISFARSQLNKVFGAGKVSDVELLEITDGDGSPVTGYAES